MANFRQLLAGAAIAVAASLSSAQAASVGDLNLPIGDRSAVIKVHGWHPYCAWGPVRYHRHVPGYGNVPCERGAHNRCHAWRRECADRWGWGGWRFRRCLDRHGC